MYGEGNSSKLVKDVMATSNQIVDGLRESTGIDISSLLAGVMAGRATAATNPPPAADGNTPA